MAMALPPNIPTSFLPHPSERGVRRSRTDFTSALGFFAYLMLVLAVVSAVGVFIYGRFLLSEKTSEDAKLAQAERGIDLPTVHNFLRLRDRFLWGEKLLGGHIALSGFFNLIETIVPNDVRFTQVHISVSDKGVVSLTAPGVAKNFNALAAASNALAKDGRVKNAIFSNIAIGQKTGAVNFSLSATLDPALIAFNPSSAAQATTTP